MARRLFEIHGSLMAAALELVQRCACPAGCPGCVGPSIGDHGTNKRAAITLLRRLTHADQPPAALTNGGQQSPSVYADVPHLLPADNEGAQPPPAAVSA
jgi:ATP-dependent helicase YprA (DUF1998 family)